MLDNKLRGIYSFRTILFLVIIYSINLNLCAQGITGIDTVRLVPDVTKKTVNIGYGFQGTSELTGSVVVVRSENFNQGNIDNPEQLIQGKIAGLSISRPGSNPNQSFEMRLRGLSTAFAGSAPLIVIDGVAGGDLRNVDPNDVESFTVLKDGSSSIYGLGASGGVILVTTKKGRPGKALIEYNGYASAEMVAKNYPVMNLAEWKSISKETGLGTDFGSNTDWLKQTEQTAISQAHNISISGGTDKTMIRASLNYRNAQGVMLKTGYTQFNGRINLSQKAFNDKLTLNLDLSATQRKSQFGFDEVFKYASISNPSSPVKSSNAQFSQYDGYFQQALYDYYNPVAILNQTLNEGKNDILNYSVRGTYEIVRGLSIDAFYSQQTVNLVQGQNFGKHDYWMGMIRNGLASKQVDKTSNKLFESTIRYIGNLGSGLHFSLMAGYSLQDFTFEGSYNKGGDFSSGDANYNNLSAAMDFKNGKGTTKNYKDLNTQRSYFGRFNMNIKDLVFINASMRYQGSSIFSNNNKWGLYPSAGAGMDLSKMLHMNSSDYLRFRVNYGLTGNQPAIHDYLSISLYSMTDIKAEKSGIFDAGLDFALAHSKVEGSFDFFTQTTSGLMFPFLTYVPPVSGLIWTNIGDLRSSGLELSFSWNVIKNEKVLYNIDLNTSYILNNSFPSLHTVINGTTLGLGTAEFGEMGAPGQYQVPVTIISEGKPVGQLPGFAYNGIDTNGRIIYVDQNRDGKIDAADRIVIGNGLPKALIGFSNSVGYKSWDLNFMFRFVLGHDIINSYRSLYEVPNMVIQYNLPETAADMRNASGQLMKTSSGTLSSKDVENGSFISLANMSLGYTFKLPVDSHFSKIRLYLAGSNLFYISGYKGSDPEPRYSDRGIGATSAYSLLITGVDRMGTWPRARSVTFGANIAF